MGGLRVCAYIRMEPACGFGKEVLAAQEPRFGRVACERSPPGRAQFDDRLRVGSSPTLSRWKDKSGSQTSRPSPGKEGFRRDGDCSSECGSVLLKPNYGGFW